jgi:hypothetical protein
LGLLVAELHPKAATRSGDRQVSVSEPAYQVKRFARRLLKSESKRVLFDVLLDGLTHVRCCAEEPVRRHEAFDALMRSLEVVRIDEEAQPSRAIGEVGKDGAR